MKQVKQEQRRVRKARKWRQPVGSVIVEQAEAKQAAKRLSEEDLLSLVVEKRNG